MESVTVVAIGTEFHNLLKLMKPDLKKSYKTICNEAIGFYAAEMGYGHTINQFVARRTFYSSLKAAKSHKKEVPASFL